MRGRQYTQTVPRQMWTVAMTQHAVLPSAMATRMSLSILKPRSSKTLRFFCKISNSERTYSLSETRIAWRVSAFICSQVQNTLTHATQGTNSHVCNSHLSTRCCGCSRLRDSEETEQVGHQSMRKGILTWQSVLYVFLFHYSNSNVLSTNLCYWQTNTVIRNAPAALTVYLNCMHIEKD